MMGYRIGPEGVKMGSRGGLEGIQLGCTFQERDRIQTLVILSNAAPPTF
jgi:hypothetical protein